VIDREPTAGEVLLSEPLKPVVYSFIGDSIESMYNGWPDGVVGAYPNGSKSAIINHAVSGNSIMSHMDAQVVAAANDNADVIILALGTNDNNAGDMGALQAEVEENLAELKLSNPKAAIYYMNVLPRWTDASGTTEVDKSNIRTAIAAACTAQKVTCWDTYSTPWITASDTSDGIHPSTTSGCGKIATEVLARL
jgi:lysophospholipase L1-like esterase